MPKEIQNNIERNTIYQNNILLIWKTFERKILDYSKENTSDYNVNI